MKSDLSSYINDVLDLVEKKEELDQIVFDLSVLEDKIGYKSVGSIREDSETENRKALIQMEMNNLGSELLKNYLLNLLEKSETWLFEPGRFKIFLEELKVAVNKIIYFRLITAVDLEKADLRKITLKLSKKMSRRVLIDLTLDKNILGGAIIQKDGYILDFSLKNKLQNLATQWKKTIQKAEE